MLTETNFIVNNKRVTIRRVICQGYRLNGLIRLQNGLTVQLPQIIVENVESSFYLFVSIHEHSPRYL
jgi:hypothetical protein